VLDNALPWDRIAPVPFRALPQSGGLVETLATEETDRAAHSADYQWLLASLSMLDASRADKALSLNLAQRQQQRTTDDQMRLTQENLRRSAHGQPPLKSIADITATDEPDVILEQAVDIMADDAQRQATQPGDSQQVARSHGSASVASP
jgi:carboxyl-terminal processing protease